MCNAFDPGEKGAFRSVRTGADGRFRVNGVGRDRVAFLIVEGGSIEQTFAIVATTADRDFKPIPLPSGGEVNLKIQSPRFEMSVAPGRAFEGTVVDRDTGGPSPVPSWKPGPREPGPSRPTPKADSASTDSPGAARITSRSRWTASPISRSSSRSRARMCSTRPGSRSLSSGASGSRARW